MATIAPNRSAFAAATVLPQAAEMRPVGAMPRGAVARYEPPLRALLSLQPWREVVIVIAYLVVTRVGSLAVKKFGVQVGPVPQKASSKDTGVIQKATIFQEQIRKVRTARRNTGIVRVRVDRSQRAFRVARRFFA
jgi:hypothetical protein